MIGEEFIQRWVRRLRREVPDGVAVFLGAATCAATPVRPATLTSTSWSRMAHETSGRSGLMPRRIGSCASMRGFAMYPGGSHPKRSRRTGRSGCGPRAAAVVLGRRRIVASPPRPVRAGASCRSAGAGALPRRPGQGRQCPPPRRRTRPAAGRTGSRPLLPGVAAAGQSGSNPRLAAATPHCSRRWRSTSLRLATATTCWSASVLLESRAAPRRCMPPRAAWRLA